MKTYVYVKYPVEGTAVAEISVDWNATYIDEINHIINLWLDAEGIQPDKSYEWKGYIIALSIKTNKGSFIIRKTRKGLRISDTIMQGRLVNTTEE